VKTRYIIEINPMKIAIADLNAPTGFRRHWTITRLNVPDEYRGFGHGTALLQKIVDDADDEQEIIQLMIYPSGPMDYDQLESWYKRYGFKWRADGDGPYMERSPRKP